MVLERYNLPVMLPIELEQLLMQVRFHQPDTARVRLGELSGDPAELAALARIARSLGDSLESCPDPDTALNNLGRFVHARGSRLQLYQLFQDDPVSCDALIQVVSASQYLGDVLVRNPEYLEIPGDTLVLRTPRTLEGLRTELDRICTPFQSKEGKLDAIRRFRRREILRIGAADLRGLSDLTQTTAQLSRLADSIVEQCLRIVSHGEAHSGLMVLALGKLGGSELNYSSDIDLVFVTDKPGRIEAATRLAQSLTAALSEVSGEGFLYRVDLRLRPYGGSGALVVSTGMLEHYLASNAHPGERQAMLKARAIAGQSEHGVESLKRIAPLLFGDSTLARRQVRDLKARIERQLRARGQMDGHVKLAPGGIRDIEFIVQALQLENGPAQCDVLSGNTLDGLTRLARAGLLAAEDAAQLTEAYGFLRVVEHRLQLMDNQQVHRLPEADRELKLLARTLGFRGADEAQEFRQAYDNHVRRVRAIFDRVLSMAGGPPYVPSG